MPMNGCGLVEPVGYIDRDILALLEAQQRSWKLAVDQHRRGRMAGDVYRATVKDQIVGPSARLQTRYRENDAQQE